MRQNAWPIDDQSTTKKRKETKQDWVSHCTTRHDTMWLNNWLWVVFLVIPTLRSQDNEHMTWCDIRIMRICMAPGRALHSHDSIALLSLWVSNMKLQKKMRNELRGQFVRSSILKEKAKVGLLSSSWISWEFFFNVPNFRFYLWTYQCQMYSFRLT